MKQYFLAGLKIIYQDGRHSKEDAEHEGEQTTKQHQDQLQIYKFVFLNIIVPKSETNQYCVFQFDIDALYQKNAEYEEDIRNSNSISDQFDIQIRDTGKKVQKFETSFEEILEKMTASAAKMDEAEKEFKDKDDDVNAAARRVVLMEGEATVSVEKLATTVMKLALMSKEADNIIKV